MALLDREAFLNRRSAAQQITLDDGTTVRVRKLTQAEVETIKKKYSTDATALEGLRFVVSRCVVDESGNRVFADDDLTKMLDVDFDILEEIAHAATEFSGLNRNRKQAQQA